MYGLDLQVRRLDVEEGDILVVRTRQVLTRAQADAAHDAVSQLVRRHGFRNVGVMVLDNCSDLTVERVSRPDTAMQHQRPRELPIVSR